jgi:hypothetical protein
MVLLSDKSCSPCQPYPPPAALVGPGMAAPFILQAGLKGGCCVWDFVAAERRGHKQPGRRRTRATPSDAS